MSEKKERMKEKKVKPSRIKVKLATEAKRSALGASITLRLNPIWKVARLIPTDGPFDSKRPVGQKTDHKAPHSRGSRSDKQK